MVERMETEEGGQRSSIGHEHALTRQCRGDGMGAEHRPAAFVGNSDERKGMVQVY
jgi:hypothetical protein